MRNIINPNSFRRFERRRARAKAATRQVPPLGAGSGGGGQVLSSQTMHFQRLWQVGSNEISLFASHSVHGDSLGDFEVYAQFLAVSQDDTEGIVAIRGNKGVRITSGPPGKPEILNEDIAGIEIQAGGDDQNITITRNINQLETIWLADGAITITSADDDGLVMITAGSELSLSVAGGTSSICMDKDGIKLKGPKIDIN